MGNNEIEQAIKIAKIISDITKTEEKVNNDVNNSGVRFRDKYTNDVRPIVAYAHKYIEETPCQCSMWKFNIPNEKIPYFGFFKELNIEINVLDVSGNDDYSVFLLGYEGFNKEYSKAQTERGVFVEPQKIRVYGYSKGTDLYGNVLTNTLGRIIKYKNKELKWNAKGCKSIDSIPYYIGDVTKLLNYQFSDDVEKEYFFHILKHLFSSEGIDTLLQSVFRDLSKTAGIKKFEIELAHTYGGKIYSYIKERLPLLELMDAQKFYDLSCIAGKNDKLYKRHFIATVRMKLKELYQRMGDVAMYWSDISNDENYSGVHEILKNIKLKEYDKGFFYN